MAMWGRGLRPRRRRAVVNLGKLACGDLRTSGSGPESRERRRSRKRTAPITKRPCRALGRHKFPFARGRERNLSQFWMARYVAASAPRGGGALAAE